MGRVRAAISLVTDWIGEMNTSTAHRITAITLPIISVRRHCLSQSQSPIASAKPSPMIGPIKGDSSIAPITTAGEDSSRPRIAIPPLIAVMNR